jgi:uncharacterized protein YdhG (YjbR/CyaY superfamily)
VAQARIHRITVGTSRTRALPDYYFRMKKATSRARASSAKSSPTFKTVDEYLSRVSEPARSTLNKIRATIRSAVPTETTEVISYGIPAFKWKKMVVWYAAFSDHCSLFPTASVIQMFKDELTGYRISKGTIHFPMDKPLPASLVKKMVKARLAQIEGKKRR